MTPTSFLAVILAIIVLRYAIAELRITEQPQNASIYSGQTHTMHCKFNELVNCTWDKNNIPVEVNNRYRYTSNSGINTKQCSLEIINFSIMDTSGWRCKTRVAQTEKHVVSKIAFLSIKFPEPEVKILLNSEPIYVLGMSNDTPWMNLTCAVESVDPIQSLQWTLDGVKIPNTTFSSNCTTFQRCYSSIAWPGGLEPLMNATSLSCFTDYRNLTSTVALHSNALSGNDAAVHAILENPNFISDAPRTTKIVIFSMLATASVVLLLVVVISLVACYRTMCKCPDPDPGLFKSTKELRYRCSSVMRLDQQEATSRLNFSVQNPLYKGESSMLRQKTSHGYVLVPDRHSRYTDPDAFPQEASYLELSSCQPFHACDCPCHFDLINTDNTNYCTGNCNSNTQTTYCPSTMQVDGDSADLEVDSEIFYIDGQPVSNANFPQTKSQPQVNINSASRRIASQAISCPDVMSADQHRSEESLYNDCVPTSSRH